MDQITLSAQQQQAVKIVVDWFQHGTDRQQVARIWGFAGCGKSTITRYIIEELGLETMDRAPDGSCGVATHKASVAMHSKWIS